MAPSTTDTPSPSVSTNNLALIDRSTVPPGQFQYRQAETNFLIVAPTWPDLMREVRKHRIANNLPIGLMFEREVEQQNAERLEKVAPNFITKYEPPIKYPMPYEEWPGWAKGIGLLKKAGEVGVGDTAERLIGHQTSAAFKTWYHSIFKEDCGCTYRKDKWNMMYAY